MTTSLPDFNGRTVAVVTIDMHRGHLDPDVATMPLPAEAAARVTKANAELLVAARKRNIPVIHVVTSYYGVEEISSNPWWKSVAGTDATRANVLNHQLPGSPGLNVMPDLLDTDYDTVVDSKKRYDAFAASELHHVLHSMGVDTILLTGVNTNSCVLATTVAGNALDYAVVVVEECVDTMDRTQHEPALDIIRKAFGWVGTTEEVLAVL